LITNILCGAKLAILLAFVLAISCVQPAWAGEEAVYSECSDLRNESRAAWAAEKAAQFLTNMKLMPVGAKAIGDTIKTIGVSKYMASLADGCELTQDTSMSSNSAQVYALTKYAIKNFAGPFGTYVGTELNIAEDILKAYQGLYNVTGNAMEDAYSACGNSLAIDITDYHWGWFRDNKLDRAVATKRIKQAAMVGSDGYPYSMWVENKYYACDGESAAGVSLAYYDILLENGQRMVVPKGATTWDGPYLRVAKLYLKNGIYSFQR
jgi:hypothetical protein